MHLTARISDWLGLLNLIAPPTLVVLAAIPIARRSGIKPRTIAITIGAGLTLVGLYLLTFWLSVRNLEISW
jgi:hypothetical protein